MAGDEIRHLRVLIANEKRERLEVLAQVVSGLEHEARRSCRARSTSAALRRVPQPAHLRAPGPDPAGEGILMAGHAIDADRAFEILRDHSQHNGPKTVDI